MRTYIEPNVKAIDSSIPNIEFFVWLKSRQWIIKDEEGNKFMTKMAPYCSEYGDWYLDIPDQFYVGDELVIKEEYLKRIDKMNLQYNNMGNIIFEINGSCLFRDILYNINKCGQWAQSNRFLFSILDKDAMYDESNYHISEEYEGIPEWEDQFTKYMEAIKNDPVVDHNRLEMPYSISSTFWYSVNRKTLIDILQWMKGFAPFFYEVYGKQMAYQTWIDEGDLQTKMSPTIEQYYKGQGTEERVDLIDDTYIVQSKMGLILYSQFIRQSDTSIAGLFNLIEHKDAEEFKHKVFKGSTKFMIKYIAHKSKVKHTLSNRLCAFAMSSGDDPCSWSYFLNRFLPDTITPTELLDLLPCTWVGKECTNCKFHDDIKFRNEGKEISNIPCPLIMKSMEIAKAKKERDHNKIGDAYYETTKYLLSDE